MGIGQGVKRYSLLASYKKKVSLGNIEYSICVTYLKESRS